MTSINDLAQAALAAVTARGYRDCDDTQFVARNLCKATEELAECGGWVLDPSADGAPSGLVDDWLLSLCQAGSAAREAFDHWTDALSITPEHLAAELPDAIIPLLCAAAVLGVDLDAAIRAKLAADVARGVRVTVLDEASALKATPMHFNPNTPAPNDPVDLNAERGVRA